ncbi:mast/stem cell growth factor receptor kita-like isoform X1 [Conger conger]|uniref:mast/stem cell growth factor receptor kita-like isoform X1 n=2 Tax=Conger conger TaxID=82655 RepID=UPI002A5AAE9B|nr:mast/stem cell growth factor receptor kita-like isoform X1 [Conger conger]
MEFSWLLFTALFLLTLKTGVLQPVLTPGGPHLVVQRGGAFALLCEDEGPVEWRRPSPARRRRVEGAEPQERRISISSAQQQQHMGRYTCSNRRGQNASIYVYVQDAGSMFQRALIPDIMAKSGHSCVLPCLGTDPGLSQLSLQPCSEPALPPGLTYSGSLERGVTIHRVQKAYEGCYVCTARLGGATVRSSQYRITVLPVAEHLPIIHLSEGELVILTKGQTFDVTCSSINVNNDFHLNWTFPHGVQPLLSRASSRLLPSSGGVLHSSSLKLSAVRRSDSGQYHCQALNEVGGATATITLQVQERGFINLTEVENSTVEIREGETLSLRVELLAYPQPHSLSWACMEHTLRNTSDHTLTSQHLGYRSFSELRLVRIKASESGVYSFTARSPEAQASRAFAVHVLSKPEIISKDGPVNGQARCVAAGYPTPEITWYYCKPPHTRCSHLLNASQERAVSMVMVSSPAFGRWAVESRVNISTGGFHTLECVATAQGQEAYSLFSVGERTVPHKLFTPLLTGFILAAALLSVCLVVLFYRYLQKPKFQIQWKVIESIHGNNYVYIDPTQLPYDPKWEFPRDKLRFGKTLGSGAFGEVVEATAYGLLKADTVMTVAVKMLKPSAHATETEALMSELKVLSYLGNHMNIVNLLGACTVGGPTLVITEYCCFGDLLNFLRQNREAFLSCELENGFYKNIPTHREPAGDSSRNGYMTMRPSNPFTSPQSIRNGAGCAEGEGDQAEPVCLQMEDLLSFSYQVAKGMDFLASRNCIHRDLAARNILLTQGRVAKICDFGLARDITSDSNYVVKGNARLPVKWMSPESIFECVYTLESDVWSYGILLWEIFSLGSSPYPGMPVSAVFYKKIREGYRMREPEFTPSHMYEVMRCCWDGDPLKRPSFHMIVEDLEAQLADSTKHIYMNFSRSFAHDQRGAHSQRLSSVGSMTQPLLHSDAFL